MWYECIPSIALVAVCLHIAPVGCYVISYLFLNKHVSCIRTVDTEVGFLV